MTRDGWRAAVIEAMDRYRAGDARFLDLIADLLADDASPQEISEADLGLPFWDLTHSDWRES